MTRQRDTAQFILGNQQRAMTLFNAIAEATHEEKARTPNTWRPCVSSFARSWKRCRLLLCGCLPLWLTACVTPPPTFVALPPIGVSPELLADCIVPPLPEPFTFGASVDYNLQLLAVIKNCNADKRALRQIEQQRRQPLES